MVTAGFPEVATIENSMHQDEAPRKDWQPEIVVFFFFFVVAVIASSADLSCSKRCSQKKLWLRNHDSVILVVRNCTDSFFVRKGSSG